MFNPEIELRIVQQRHEDRLRFADRQQLYQQLKQNQPNRLEQLNHRITNGVRRLSSARTANGFLRQVEAAQKKLAMKLFWINHNGVPAYPQGYLLRRDNHDRY